MHLNIAARVFRTSPPTPRRQSPRIRGKWARIDDEFVRITIFREKHDIRLLSKHLALQVNTGSPAEAAGLKAGDAVIRVNNTEMYNLRHKDAQDVIVRAGNNFELTIQR